MPSKRVVKYQILGRITRNLRPFFSKLSGTPTITSCAPRLCQTGRNRSVIITLQGILPGSRGCPRNVDRGADNRMVPNDAVVFAYLPSYYLLTPISHPILRARHDFCITTRKSCGIAASFPCVARECGDQKCFSIPRNYGSMMARRPCLTIILPAEIEIT
jgi:hypothetical protein